MSDAEYVQVNIHQHGYKLFYEVCDMLERDHQAEPMKLEVLSAYLDEAIRLVRLVLEVQHALNAEKEVPMKLEEWNAQANALLTRIALDVHCKGPSEPFGGQ